MRTVLTNYTETYILPFSNSEDETGGKTPAYDQRAMGTNKQSAPGIAKIGPAQTLCNHSARAVRGKI